MARTLQDRILAAGLSDDGVLSTWLFMKRIGTDRCISTVLKTAGRAACGERPWSRVLFPFSAATALLSAEQLESAAFHVVAVNPSDLRGSIGRRRFLERQCRL